MIKISRNLFAVLCLGGCLPVAALAQGYTVKWSDPTTYSLSCGSITGKKWVVSNDSCVFLSADIDAGGVPGDPDKRAAFSIRINPTGNLTDNDFAYVLVRTNAALRKTIAVRGDTVSAAFDLAFDVVVPPQSRSVIQIIFNTDRSQEKWRIEDEGIAVSFPAAPLPVELASFTGAIRDGIVTLEWITRSELNNDYFTVERSADGQAFVPVARIEGKGTTTTLSYYGYRDTYTGGQPVYYRLRQTDYNGRYNYMGKVITLKPARVNPEVSVFPNPVPGETLHVLIRDCRNQEVHIELRGTNGVVQYAGTVVPTGDVLDYVLHRHDLGLRRGMYLLTVKLHDRIYSERVIITG